MPTMRETMIDLGVMLAIGLVLALLGPFGTFGAPFVYRLLYWLTLLVAGYFVYLPAMRLASRTATRLDLPEPALWAAACVFATGPMSVVVWCADFVNGPARWPSLDEAAQVYGNVLIVGMIACTIIWFTGTRRRAVEPVSDLAPLPSPVIAPPVPRFIDRLPPHLGTDLIALEMEDHYVRAHTLAGSALILLRMRDAVAELGSLDGMQVHRSWWVARHAVTGSNREGRNVRLILTNGSQAPVARDMVPVLRTGGWL